MSVLSVLGLIALWFALMALFVFLSRSAYTLVDKTANPLTFRHKDGHEVSIALTHADTPAADMVETAYRIMGRRGIYKHLVLKAGLVSALEDGTCTVTLPQGAELKTAYVSNFIRSDIVRLNFSYNGQLLVVYIPLTA